MPLSGVVLGVCSFLQFVVYVTFFIVILSVVRPRRPDAGVPLAVGSGILVFDFAVRWIGLSILPVLLARSAAPGMDTFYFGQMMFSITGLMLSVIGWILIMIGIVRLASPPREQSLNRAPGDY